MGISENPSPAKKKIRLAPYASDWCLNYVSPLCDIFLHSRVECIMPYDPDRHARRSIRMRAYDYAQPGAYFVTVCTQNRECLFGEVMHGEMRLNDPGKMVRSAWDELPRHYPGVNVDGFVVMPNHIHGIVVLKTVGAGPRACPDIWGACPDIWGACPDDGQPRGVAPTMSLPDVVHRFKSLTTTRYRHGIDQQGWRPFPGRLWQRNYYEHVIRDEAELHGIRQYIIDNPKQWGIDQENPRRR